MESNTITKRQRIAILKLAITLIDMTRSQGICYAISTAAQTVLKYDKFIYHSPSEIREILGVHRPKNGYTSWIWWWCSFDHKADSVRRSHLRRALRRITGPIKTVKRKR